MPDFLTVLSRWWKAVLGLVAAVTAVALVLLFTAQKQYLSTVTALPANSLAFDKGRIFNNSIQELYSSLGTPDELDPIIGTAKLDTLYRAMVNDFNLVAHYAVEKKKNPVHTATKLLKANASVAKDEFGQLKIRVWDLDPNFAATLAHGLYERLQALHQYLQNQSNEMVLAKLKESERMLSNDSTTASPFNTEWEMEQKKQYQKLIAEYNMMISTKPQVLLLVEDARPDVKPDRPKFWLVLSVAVFGALMFGILLALFLESRKRS